MGMKKYVEKYMLITFGGFIQGLAMNLFLFPNSIPSGGAAGIAILLNYFFNIPVGIGLWFVNFSLLLAAIKWLGNESTIGTMYSITITSITVHYLDFYLTTGNEWWDVLFGGVLLGIGVGTLLRQEVSNGGIGIVALIIAKYKTVAPGKPLFLINGFIFFLTALIIEWEIIIQAIISQFISTKIIDLIYKLDIKETLLFTSHISFKRK